MGVRSIRRSKLKTYCYSSFNLPILFTSKSSDSRLKFEDSWVKNFESYEMLLLDVLYFILVFIALIFN